MLEDLQKLNTVLKDKAEALALLVKLRHEVMTSVNQGLMSDDLKRQALMGTISQCHQLGKVIFQKDVLFVSLYERLLSELGIVKLDELDALRRKSFAESQKYIEYIQDIEAILRDQNEGFEESSLAVSKLNQGVSKFNHASNAYKKR